MTYFLIGLGVILAYLLASILAGVSLGIIEYFRIKSGKIVDPDTGLNMKSCFNRGILEDIVLEAFSAVFYNRVISSILAIIFYPLKAWSRNIVYNHFFRNNFRFRCNIHRKFKLYNLKNDKFKNGFYATARGNTGVSKSYKSKNMIVGYRNDLMSHILFPIAFMIWLYNNDNNPYDMSGLKSASNTLVNTLVHKRIPKFLHKYIFDKNIGKDMGSYLDVGDNLIKEPAYISFILNRLFLYEDRDMNINMYFDN